MKLLRWLLLLAVLGGIAYAAVAVPIGGRTLLARLRGDAPQAVDAPAAGHPTPSGPAKALPPAVEGQPGTDAHTDADRHQLNELIESKLGEERRAPAKGAPRRDP